MARAASTRAQPTRSLSTSTRRSHDAPITHEHLISPRAQPFHSYDNKNGAYRSSRMRSGRRTTVAQAHAHPLYTPGVETLRWLSSTAHFAHVTDADVWSSGVATRARVQEWRCKSIGAYRHHHFVQKSHACGDFGGSSAASTVFFEREGALNRPEYKSEAS